MKTLNSFFGVILTMTMSCGLWGGEVLAHSGHDHAQGAHDHAPSAHNHAGGAHGSMIHLSYPLAGIHAHATWAEGPVVGAESRLRVEWKSALDHSSVTPAGDFEVVLWMPSMNHGSAPTEVQPLWDEDGKALVGVFEVSNIYFVMGGDWEVRITLLNPDGTTETQSFALDLLDDPEAPGHDVHHDHNHDHGRDHHRDHGSDHAHHHDHGAQGDLHGGQH